GLLVDTFAGQSDGVNLAVDPDGRIVVTGGRDGSLAAWSLAGDERLGRTFEFKSGDFDCFFVCAVLSPNGDLMDEELDGETSQGAVVVVDINTGRRVAMLPARGKSLVYALAFSPDNRTLVTGGDPGTIRFWDIYNRAVVRSIPGLDPIASLAVS